MISRDQALRFARQTRFAGLGQAGQEALAAAKVLIVGVGGLGSWAAELLARAGVGAMRLVDADRIDINNIHRQAMYIEADCSGDVFKVDAAAKRLVKINSALWIEKFPQRLTGENIGELAAGVDLILDGSDNFPTRFVINDYAISAHLPWVFGGAAGAEGQVMTIIPGVTPCLRCLFEPPPADLPELSSVTVGVMGPAVAAISAMQAMEAIKIIVGHYKSAAPRLMKLDLWTGHVRTLDASPLDGCLCRATTTR